MKLIPKTLKGKNKIREAGTDEWRIIRETTSAACFDGAAAIMIEPVLEDRAFAGQKARWIRKINDADFDLQNR